MQGKNEFFSLSTEQGYDEVEKLSNTLRDDSEGATCYSGVHPIWGSVVIIFPAFGNPIGHRDWRPSPTMMMPEVTVIKNPDVPGPV